MYEMWYALALCALSKPKTKSKMACVRGIWKADVMTTKCRQLRTSVRVTRVKNAFP
jgi:hypothetical protein